MGHRVRADARRARAGAPATTGAPRSCARRGRTSPARGLVQLPQERGGARPRPVVEGQRDEPAPSAAAVHGSPALREARDGGGLGGETRQARPPRRRADARRRDRRGLRPAAGETGGEGERGAGARGAGASAASPVRGTPASSQRPSSGADGGPGEGWRRRPSIGLSFRRRERRAAWRRAGRAARPRPGRVRRRAPPRRRGRRCPAAARRPRPPAPVAQRVEHRQDEDRLRGRRHRGQPRRGRRRAGRSSRVMRASASASTTARATRAAARRARRSPPRRGPAVASMMSVAQGSSRGGRCSTAVIPSSQRRMRTPSAARWRVTVRAAARPSGGPRRARRCSAGSSERSAATGGPPVLGRRPARREVLRARRRGRAPRAAVVVAIARAPQQLGARAGAADAQGASGSSSSPIAGSADLQCRRRCRRHPHSMHLSCAKL